MVGAALADSVLIVQCSRYAIRVPDTHSFCCPLSGMKGTCMPQDPFYKLANPAASLLPPISPYLSLPLAA